MGLSTGSLGGLRRHRERCQAHKPAGACRGVLGGEEFLRGGIGRAWRGRGTVEGGSDSLRAGEQKRLMPRFKTAGEEVNIESLGEKV